MRENLEDTAFRILGNCLISNHAHIIGIPAREDSLSDWIERLRDQDSAVKLALRACTHAGPPFGEKSLVEEMAARVGRYWSRGRPGKKKKAAAAKLAGDIAESAAQSELS